MFKCINFISVVIDHKKRHEKSSVFFFLTHCNINVDENTHLHMLLYKHYLSLTMVKRLGEILTLGKSFHFMIECLKFYVNYFQAI